LVDEGLVTLEACEVVRYVGRTIRANSDNTDPEGEESL
jgi:hypothetical protein